jgi:hypothetical protein
MAYHLIFDPKTRLLSSYAEGPEGFTPAGLTAQVDTLPADLAATLLAEDGTVVQDVNAVLAILKPATVAKVKQEAADRIKALDWRIDRAHEQAALGVAGVETVEDVMLLRQDIREKSNVAETAVQALMRPEEVLAFTW